MKRTCVTGAALVAAMWSSSAFAVELVKRENLEFRVSGRSQIFGFVEKVNDPFRPDGRLYLFLKQARLNFAGRFDDYKYNVELAFAGEEEVRAPSPGVSLNLLDFSFDLPVNDASYFKIGQFKAPYSRERLAYSQYLLFADRSIQSLAFRVGRDVGIAYGSKNGRFAVTGGVFTGGGRDVPERYLPQDLGVPMLVVRTGYNDGLDDDLYQLKQNDFGPSRAGTAAFLNAMYLKDSIVGHSTVLNVKTAEKSLLINSNWNPYISRTPLSKGQLWQLGADVALRRPVGDVSLSAEAEVNYGGYDNAYGTLHAAGGRVQGGVLWNPVELAVRYAVIAPDEKFAYFDSATNRSYQITGTRVIQEVTPALTYFLKGSSAKLIADMPLLIGVPVVLENNVGAYVLTEQQDQTSVLKSGGRVERQTVIEARLLVQLAF